MKVIGIVAEFNPFHLGHKYLIDTTKEKLNADLVICVMSGNFTQTGNIAILDKFKRAKLAISNGVDIVIELPFIYSNSSANLFSYGALNILDKIGVVDILSFGSEIGSTTILQDLYNKISDKQYFVDKYIKENLKSNLSYANIRENALKTFLSNYEINILRNPNNILGFEYIKAINSLNSKIKSFSIKREINNHNSNKMPNLGNFASATAIRSQVLSGNFENIVNYVPKDTYFELRNNTLTNNDMIFHILKYKILNCDINYLNSINEVNEGLEYKIKNEIKNSNDYTSFINNIKSKRYKMSRIKRILNNILLDITKLDFNEYYKNNSCYAHILAASENGKKLFSEISNNLKKNNSYFLPKITDDIILNLDNTTKRIIQKDIMASNFYSIITNNNINLDYKNKL